VKEATTHRSNMSPDMSTKNVGSITPQGGSPTSSHGRLGRGGYEEAEDFEPGPQEHMGLGGDDYLNPAEGCDGDGY
jgi:hypothetical protein